MIVQCYEYVFINQLSVISLTFQESAPLIVVFDRRVVGVGAREHEQMKHLVAAELRNTDIDGQFALEGYTSGAKGAGLLARVGTRQRRTKMSNLPTAQRSGTRSAYLQRHHSLTHSRTHPLTHAPTHSLTHSLTPRSPKAPKPQRSPS